MPTGGTANQYLVKLSGDDYDTSWKSPVNNLTTGTTGGVLDASQGKVLKDSRDATQGSIAIISEGDTHNAINAGEFVYVRGHSTLAEGLYKADSNIAANGALSSSNLTAAPGALNGLAGDISTLNSNMSSNQKNLALQDWEGKAPRSMYTGDFIYWNNVLYRAKQSISGGTTLTSSMLESVQMTNASSLPGALNVINSKIANIGATVSNSGLTDGLYSIILRDGSVSSMWFSVTTYLNTTNAVNVSQIVQNASNTFWVKCDIALSSGSIVVRNAKYGQINSTTGLGNDASISIISIQKIASLSFLNVLMN